MAANSWWEPDKDDKDDERTRALALESETARIEERQAAWSEYSLWNATLYSNRELVGFRWGAEINAEKELWPSNLRTENIIENIGTAMLSKAASSPIRPAMVPHGNSWRVAREVRVADKFLFGVWRQTRAEIAALQMFNDAYTCGLGCVQVAYDRDGKTLAVESVFFDNVVIDNRECANRAAPKTYRVRKVVQRKAIEGMYGTALTKSSTPYVTTRPMGDDWVPIIEAWRLPDADGKGGRHAVSTCGVLLVDEAWKHEWVPLVFFHWQDRLSGFFGKGGVEQVLPYQVIQNELNDDIKESQDVGCRPRILAHANSNLSMDQWDSKPGRILLYSGTKPESLSIQTNLAELYNERERNKAAAYSHMGLSEMFSNADMPNQVRLDSSAGVREFRNMEDARHLRLWTAYEQARLDIARTIMNVLAVSKGAEAYTTVYRPAGARATGKNIPYEAVKHLTEEQYSWTFEATPLSMQSPAARRELLKDMASRGEMQFTEDNKMTMSNPNLEMLEELELSSKDDIERHMEILEDGGYEAPDEMTNLTLGTTMVMANYHRLLRFEDVKKTDPMMVAHKRWVMTATSIVTAAAQPPPTQMTPFSPTQGVAGTYGNTAAGTPAPMQ